MDKNTLKKQSKSKLINLLLQLKKQTKLLFQKIKLLSQQNVKQHFKNDNDYKPRKPIPTPRKSVKQMAQEYEDNIILPPLEFRDDYKPIPLPRTKKTVPLPRTKIEQTDKALKGYTKSYEISIKNTKDPLVQLQNTRKAVAYHTLYH